MRSMHSECIPAQYQDQDPRFAQKSCGKSWKYQDQDPRFAQKSCGKSWTYQDQDPRFGKSWKYQDQDPRFAQKSCGKSWKFQDLENLGNTKTKIQDLHRSLVENLAKIQDPIPRFPTRLLCKSWILVLVFPRFSKSWILVLVFPRFSTRLLCKSWILVQSWYFQDFPQDFCANLGSWSWYWAGMHSLAFSGQESF